MFLLLSYYFFLAIIVFLFSSDEAMYCLVLEGSSPKTVRIVETTDLGEGQMGSALMGSLHFLVVSFDRGTFCVFSLTYFYLPKSARAYLFYQSVKIHYFCSGPVSADPIRP